MKLINMHVDNFGGLHDYNYQFEDGLNVILQDNGWGKTTMAVFLKAMLYGFDTKRSKDITENERKRYFPWTGGKYGGSLDFEANGDRYRIYRTFGETARFDTIKIINLDTKTTAKIPPDKIGETLFHLDANAFQRSVFINQNGLEIDGAASSIHSRLNTLVSQTNDLDTYDGAISDLTQQIKVYEKTGDRGELGNIKHQIAEKEKIRDRLEKDISEQDAARERISQIDFELNEIDLKLEEKNKKLEKLSGEEKKREAAKKQLNDINNQISDLQQQINAIMSVLGGSVPTSAEIDEIKQKTKSAEALKNQVRNLENSLAKYAEEYNKLSANYNGVFPTAAQLDEIQSIYGELKGINSASDNEEQATTVPEEYVIIKSAVDTDPEYIKRLQSVVGLQISFQEMIRKLEAQERELKSITDSWNEKSKRYKSLRNESDRIRKDINTQERFKPETTEPIIAKLEEIQRKEQEVGIIQESFASDFLSDEEEQFLLNNPDEQPNIIEGRTILNKQRDIVRLQSEIQGLKSSQEGEKIKDESLKYSLEQIENELSSDTIIPEKPGKSSGNVMIIIGAGVTAIGIFLGFFHLPVLFGISVIGVALIISGIVANNNYKKKIQAYDEWQKKAAQNEELIHKKEFLLDQQKIVQGNIAYYEQQIVFRQNELIADETMVNNWCSQWTDVPEIVSETTILMMLNKADELQKLRERKNKIELSRESVEKQVNNIRNEREKIDKDYPEFSEKSTIDAINYLREKTNNYKMIHSKLDKAIQNENEFIDENGYSRDVWVLMESPKANELKTLRDSTDKALQKQLNSANKELALLGLDTDQDHIIMALHKAEIMINEYTRYAEKKNDQEKRQNQKQKQIDNLNEKLNTALIVIAERYSDRDIPERLSLVRSETNKASNLNSKIKEIESELDKQQRNLIAEEDFISKFSNKHNGFLGEQESILPQIYEKTSKFSKLNTSKQQLEKQRESVLNDPLFKAIVGDDEDEAALKTIISELKEQRDNLLIEYTQKDDFIRQADQSLEAYPDIIQEIHELYEQKQNAMNSLAILKRSVQLITQAKENLANRYLSRVEDLFNSYMHIWLNNDSIKGLLDVNFNISIEENGKTHIAEGYSTGYCDMIDFCMRLALIDTLFENEQPFLILDDPFVNLDIDRLEKAMELLNVMAANKQVIYFVCHPIRALETNEDSASRAEFLKLAEATKQMIIEHHTTETVKKKSIQKTPKELYKVKDSSVVLPFKPVKPNYVITNNIFNMDFEPNEENLQKNSAYDLFFIDAVGHVLNDRQMLEVSNGKLSTNRIQFSLNTRDNSGDEFELIVRESGKDDFDVVSKIPFRAKLAFTGTYNFEV